MWRSIITTIFLGILVIPGLASAQEYVEPIRTIIEARVQEVTEELTETLELSNQDILVQTLLVEFLEGEHEGEFAEITNDYVPVEAGDVVFVVITEDTLSNTTYYAVMEIKRSGPIIWLGILFIVAVLVFAGKQGFRSLLSLAGSLMVVIYLLVPGLVAGYPPILTSIVLAGLILFFAVFFTHGFNRRSLIAFLGTVSGVILTGLLAALVVTATKMTGFTTDETVYLNVNTLGELDLAGLLLAGIIIGVLGVLDDIAVTQVAVVRELYAVGNLDKWDIYRRAIRVGREHVSALVNTLVLAYTGVALPLLLLVESAGSDIGLFMNQEIFAAEAIRTLVGSIGLILTVPLTTLLAVFMLERYRGQEIPEGEQHQGCAHGHVHAH